MSDDVQHTEGRIARAGLFVVAFFVGGVTQYDQERVRRPRDRMDGTAPYVVLEVWRLLRK